MVGHGRPAQGQEFGQTFEADALPRFEQEQNFLPRGVAKGRKYPGHGFPVIRQSLQILRVHALS